MLSKQLFKGFAVAAVGAALSLSVQAAEFTGAGATFPFPIYSKWAEAYKASTGIGLNYQSIGSGGGMRQIKAKTVDFGASDQPMKPDELEKKVCCNSRQLLAAWCRCSTWTASSPVS